mgnify:CR=1 FL=1
MNSASIMTMGLALYVKLNFSFKLLDPGHGFLRGYLEEFLSPINQIQSFVLESGVQELFERRRVCRIGKSMDIK